MSRFRQTWISVCPLDVAARLYDGWHLDRVVSARNPQNGRPTQVAIMRRPLVLGDEDLPTIKHGVGGATRRCPDKHRAPVAHFIPLVGATGTLPEPTGCADDCTHPDHGHRA